MMNRSKWFIHPIMILVISVVAVFTSLVLYIFWYVEVSLGLQEAIETAGSDSDLIFTPQTWVVILVLSILVGLIIFGITVIFTYHQKTLQLYRLQRNFINNFTHELKTPVASLKLYLETFSKHQLPRDDQLKYLKHMIQDADRLTDNINRILSLAKIENRTLKGEFKDTELVSFTRRFVEKNLHIFKECDISIHNPSERQYNYLIDSSLFEMVMINLLNNAIKYNQSERPVVKISFEPTGDNLHINFADNGIGLPPQQTKKIFRNFYQIGQSDDMSAKGTGVGLYLVDSIIRLHKGRIKASSPGPGQGSVFSLILPLNPSQQKA